MVVKLGVVMRWNQLWVDGGHLRTNLESRWSSNWGWCNQLGIDGGRCDGLVVVKLGVEVMVTNRGLITSTINHTRVEVVIRVAVKLVMVKPTEDC